ncbi:MAG: hypothetical protein RLZZ219_696 [Cyanobacteriota bacterium]
MALPRRPHRRPAGAAADGPHQPSTPGPAPGAGGRPRAAGIRGLAPWLRTLPRLIPRPAGLALSAALLLPIAPTAAEALELQGRTWFTSPPWRVEFRSYAWYVMQTGVEYYFTLTMPAAAGASLGGLEIQQTRGVDTHFPFMAERTRAFLGRPRREGASIAVLASFDARSRRMRVRFPQPPEPGQTITVALRPWANPSQADTYLFAVQALPAGPDPVPASLGYATMPIYDGPRF